MQDGMVQSNKIFLKSYHKIIVIQNDTFKLIARPLFIIWKHFSAILKLFNACNFIIKVKQHSFYLVYYSNL